MMEIKSFNLKSLFKIGLSLYLALMVFVGLIGMLFLLFNLVTNFSTGSLAAAGGAILVYVLMTVLYAILSGIIFVVVGFVYNKLAEKIGGIKLELEKIN